MAGSLTGFTVEQDGRTLRVATSETLPADYDHPCPTTAVPSLSNGSRTITSWKCVGATHNPDTTYAVEIHYECDHADRILYSERADSWQVSWGAALFTDRHGNTSDATQAASSTGRLIQTIMDSDGFLHESFKAARSTTGQAALDPIADLAFDVVYDADAETGFADGGNVTGLTDQSGNGYNATKTGTGTVTWEDTELDGQAVYRFTGAASTYYPVPTLTLDASTDTVTMVAVLKIPADSGSNVAKYVCSLMTGSTTVSGITANSYGTGNNGKAKVNGTFSYAGNTTGFYVFGEWVIVVYRKAPTTRRLLEQGVVSLSDSVAAPGSATHSFRVGAKADASDPYTSDIAWVGFKVGSLTDAQLLGITEHLATRFAIPLSRTTHVSTSGNDSNAGTEASPVLTAAEAGKRCRPLFKDRIRFKRGDTFTGTITRPTAAGTDADTWCVFDAYGSGARPVFEVANGGTAISEGGTNAPRWWAIEGVTLRCPVRDPDDPAWVDVATMSNTGEGVRLTGTTAGEWCMSDCVIENFPEGFNIQGSAPATPKQAILNRCIIRNNCRKGTDVDASGNRSQGVFMNSTMELRVYDCVVDHNGWSSHATLATDCPSVIFSHNFYMTLSGARSFLSRCLVTRGSLHGAAHGNGGAWRHNIHQRNAIAGFVRQKQTTSTGHSFTIGRCFLGPGRRIDAGTSTGNRNQGAILDAGRINCVFNLGICDDQTYAEGFMFEIQNGDAQNNLDTNLWRNTGRWWGDIHARTIGSTNLVRQAWRRNIFLASGTPASTAYLVQNSADDFAKLVADYNAYVSSDAAPFRSTSTDYNFTDWKTATSVDTNSRQESSITFTEERILEDYEDYLGSTSGSTLQDYIDRVAGRAGGVWTASHWVDAAIEWMLAGWVPTSLVLTNYDGLSVGAADYSTSTRYVTVPFVGGALVLAIQE
jgi:hypothetical protein